MFLPIAAGSSPHQCLPSLRFKAPSTLLVEFDSAAGQNALYVDVTNRR